MPAASRRADKVIGLLEMKADADGGDATPALVDLRAVLEDLARYYKLNFTIQGEGSWLGERHRLASVFDTLLKNVQDKALQDPDLRCHLGISEQGENFKVVVADTGKPIVEPERVFQPFYSTKPGGLGIGLYHAKHLVDSMKGHIACKNSPQGVEFELLLPKL